MHAPHLPAALGRRAPAPARAGPAARGVRRPHPCPRTGLEGARQGRARQRGMTLEPWYS